ncbi:MAG: glucose-6-phosphate isomerase [Chlamydiae bacterium]|nr:glucose-6-phosphate isomerase [Chlamydiota bacterium]
MKKFSALSSFYKLKKLAENPIDLTKKGILTPQRIEEMFSEEVGLKFFYATERMDEQTLSALFELAKETEAVHKMRSMQAGEIVNVIERYESEKRPALHTAMRDFFEEKEETQRAKEAASLAYKELEKLKNFLQKIETKKRFTHLVQIGIGGSDLGPRAVYYALEAYKRPMRKVSFISNVDPDDGAQVLSEVELENTLFVVVSKSGRTLETQTNEEFVIQKLKAKNLDPKNQIIAVTGQGSPMDDPSKYLASFYIWDYVGGRYSTASMVGAVTLAFALGMDQFLDFLRGASKMDKLAKIPDPKRNLPLLSALLGIWNRNFLLHPTCAVIPYSQALHRFPAHLQQLDMESNGKRIDKEGNPVNFSTGPIIWGEPGTNGQHSFYQSLHQGTDIAPIEMVGFKESQYGKDLEVQGTSSQEKLLSNLIAQSIAFALGEKNPNPNKVCAGNRPNHILFAEKLTPYSLGLILSYYEHKVAFQGFIWNINSFDQEGVQLGKTLASKMIDQFIQKKKQKTIDERAFPLGAAFLKKIFS